MSKYNELKKENIALWILNDEIIGINLNLREENKKLKLDLAFERTMLDNVQLEYESLQKIVKSLKEENEKLKNENISLHIEIEEIKDDWNLSYEERLYSNN